MLLFVFAIILLIIAAIIYGKNTIVDGKDVYHLRPWIQAIATAKPSVINSAGPCAPAEVGTGSSTIVQVP